MAKQGTVIAVGGLGVLLVWSGVSNKSFLVSARDVVQGVQPSAGPPTPLLSGGSTSGTASGTTAGTTAGGTGGNVKPNSAPGGQQDQATRNANQALGKQMAASYGWSTGPEWTALNNVAMRESGWDALIANPTSDARGIAQNINGWSSNYQEGNAAQQIAWMLAYIKQRYGDPIGAWNHELSSGWY